MRSLSLAVVSLALLGCSAPEPPALIEYPPLPHEAGTGDSPRADASPLPDGGPGQTTDAGEDGAPARDASSDVAAPTEGTKLLDGSVFIRSATSDGHLVFEHGTDLLVWPRGASAPVTFVKDYGAANDSFLVRGRFAAAWLADSVMPSEPRLWSQAGGVETLSAKVWRDAIYPRPAREDLAYLVRTVSATAGELWLTRAGGGTGARVVSDLDTGALSTGCRPTITFGAAELVVGGCVNGSTDFTVVSYALDGSRPPKTLLTGGSPGVFVNRARTWALVQTSVASSLRSLSGANADVPIDGPVTQAVFSADDKTVVLQRTDGSVRIASTTSPASPREIYPKAIALLAVSPDARFVAVATAGDPKNGVSDIIAVDTTGKTAPRTITASPKAWFVGMAADGARIAFREEVGSGLGAPLWVVPLPSGAPEKVSDAATRPAFGDGVVYFQEYVPAKKVSVLRGARLARPTEAVTIAEGLDALTTHVQPVGSDLFVASKIGLWRFSALAP